MPGVDGRFENDLRILASPGDERWLCARRHGNEGDAAITTGLFLNETVATRRSWGMSFSSTTMSYRVNNVLRDCGPFDETM